MCGFPQHRKIVVSPTLSQPISNTNGIANHLHCTLGPRWQWVERRSNIHDHTCSFCVHFPHIIRAANPFLGRKRFLSRAAASRARTSAGLSLSLSLYLPDIYPFVKQAAETAAGVCPRARKSCARRRPSIENSTFLCVRVVEHWCLGEVTVERVLESHRTRALESASELSIPHESGTGNVPELRVENET